MTDRGPVGLLGGIALRPVSWIWRAVAHHRNARFDEGVGVRRAAVPVVSVGNITAGGTGKTPFVAWLASALQAQGHRPAIAMRGYGASDGGQSDEAREYAMTLRDVPVLVGADRFASITAWLDAHPGTIDVVILDDGFQHRQLARDIDIALVDAQRPALDSPILPSGWLREPAEGLRRASAVVVTRADRVDEALGARILALHGKRPVAWCRHVWRGVDVMRGCNAERHEVSWLHGRKVYGVFGVGHPEAVCAAYERAGASVVEQARVRDHATYEAGDVARWVSRADACGAEVIATTRKDWTKIREIPLPESRPFVVPDVAIEFIAGEADVSALARSAFP